MSQPLLARLAEGLARPCGKSERQRARWHLLDWLACIAGGRRSAAFAVARAISPDGWERASYLGNVLEMDDVHRAALLHPGPVIWPAAMSLAEADMDSRLDAAVRGYEAMIALGAAMDARHYRHWHPTATMGGMGAAACMASLLDIGPGKTAEAMANAGSVAGGLWHMRHDDVLTKQWHVFHAVRTGREAARHTALGASGPKALLEGPQGLFAAFTDAPRALAHAQDGGWLIGEVSFKPFAACRHAHPAIDAALCLRGEGRLRPPFMVETYADALAFCDRPDPQTELEAKFSLQHAVAVVASGRSAAPEDFTSEAIAALAPLRAAVTVREDPRITARYPAHFGARVNGFELVDCLGDPERPIGEEHLLAKLASLVRWGGLAASEAERAARLALEGDDPQALDALIAEWTR